MRSRKRSVLDERELMEMYRMEHIGLWLMYGLLCASIFVQLFLGADRVQLAGEATAVLATSVVMIVGNARRGIWSMNSRPSARGNAACALACGVLVAALLTLLGKAAGGALLAGLCTGVLCMLLLTVLMQYMKRRQQKTEETLNDE